MVLFLIPLSLSKKEGERIWKRKQLESFESSLQMTSSCFIDCTGILQLSFYGVFPLRKVILWFWSGAATCLAWHDSVMWKKVGTVVMALLHWTWWGSDVLHLCYSFVMCLGSKTRIVLHCGSSSMCEFIALFFLWGSSPPTPTHTHTKTCDVRAICLVSKPQLRLPYFFSSSALMQ